MIVEIPDQVIAQSEFSAKELLLKVAIMLFQEEKLTLGQASKLARLHQARISERISRQKNLNPKISPFADVRL